MSRWKEGRKEKTAVAAGLVCVEWGGGFVSLIDILLFGLEAAESQLALLCLSP